jgi:tight adherence protein B
MITLVPGLDQTTELAIILGVGVFAILVGMYVALVPTAAQQRLEGYVGTLTPVSGRARYNLRRGSSNLLDALDRQLRRRQQALTTRALLIRADLSMTLGEFVAARCVVALAATLGIALTAVPRFGLPAVPIAIVAGLIASYLPVLYLHLMARRRVAKIEAQLPDTLDMIAASLQAGGALTQSFSLIARDQPEPMNGEFKQILREIEVGLSVNEALSNFARRIDSEDIDLFVTTVNVQTRVGGNLVQILRTINHTIRERIRIRGEIVVLTAMQRMSAYVISALPPVLALVLYLINPGYMSRLVEPGIGPILLILSLLMAVTGYVILQRITAIDI